MQDDRRLFVYNVVMRISIDDQFEKLHTNDTSPLARLRQALDSPFLWMVVTMSVIVMLFFISLGQDTKGTIPIQTSTRPMSTTPTPMGVTATPDVALTPVEVSALAFPTAIPLRQVPLGAPRYSPSDASAAADFSSSPTPDSVIPVNTHYDTIPPRSAILFPLPGGVISTYTHGRVCLLLAPLRDDVTSTTDIIFTYNFDANLPISDKGIDTVCSNFLFNGEHTLTYFAVDAAGNKESSRTIGFIVSISGNDQPTIAPSPTPSATPSPIPTMKVTAR